MYQAIYRGLITSGINSNMNMKWCFCLVVDLVKNFWIQQKLKYSFNHWGVKIDSSLHDLINSPNWLWRKNQYTFMKINFPCSRTTLSDQNQPNLLIHWIQYRLKVWSALVSIGKTLRLNFNGLSKKKCMLMTDNVINIFCRVQNSPWIWYLN